MNLVTDVQFLSRYSKFFLKWSPLSSSGTEKLFSTLAGIPPSYVTGILFLVSNPNTLLAFLFGLNSPCLIASLKLKSVIENKAITLTLVFGTVPTLYLGIMLAYLLNGFFLKSFTRLYILVLISSSRDLSLILLSHHAINPWKSPVCVHCSTFLRILFLAFLTIPA